MLSHHTHLLLAAPPSAVLTVQRRGIVVPNQLTAYGGTFNPSIGERSSHLDSTVVLQKMTNRARDAVLRTVKTKCVESFEDMLLPSVVRDALKSLRVSVPSPIQQTAIEVGLQRKDVLLAAQHGEGKTIAFLAPLYANMVRDRDMYKIPLRERRPRAVILCPTRELMTQIQHVCRSFDAATSLTSVQFSSKRRAISKVNKMLKNTMPDVLVMHPRQVLRLVRSRRLFIEDLRYLVVDEADTMLSQAHDFEAFHLISMIRRRNMYKHLWPVKTQFFFSTAMITRSVEYFVAKKFPEAVSCYRSSELHHAPHNLRHLFYPIQRTPHKLDVLMHLLRKHRHTQQVPLTDEEENRLRSGVFVPLANVGLAELAESSTGGGHGKKKHPPPPPEDEGANPGTLSPPPVEKSFETITGRKSKRSRPEKSTGTVSGPSSSPAEISKMGRTSPILHSEEGRTTVASVAGQKSSTDADQPSLETCRLRVERAAPVHWEHQVTLPAPFTCPIQRTHYGVGKRTIIFFRNIDSCTALYHKLHQQGFVVALLHASLPTEVRKENFRRFASGECNILLATDAASRGLDMHVDLVINFDMPTNAVAYLSRCGRAARMGRHGIVASLFTKHQSVIVSVIKQFVKKRVALDGVSNERRDMMNPRHAEWKVNKINALTRAYVSMITRKTIPHHLEKTYIRHNALWRPLFHPRKTATHGGVHPLQQHKLMNRVMEDAVSFRRGELSRRKGGRAKFGRKQYGVWNTHEGTKGGSTAGESQSDSPAGSDFGPPQGPPK